MSIPLHWSAKQIIDNHMKESKENNDKFNNKKKEGGKMSGVLAGVGATLQGLGGLAQAWVGYEQLEESKKQNRFQAALANRNLKNQAKQINSTYDTAGRIGAAMQGLVKTREDGTQYSSSNNEQAFKEHAELAKSQHVDGSEIEYKD